MSIHPEIARLVDATPFIDTHEHLVEESTRLAEPGKHWTYPCNDWAYLLTGYAASDLISAGMPWEDHNRFVGMDADPEEKWRLCEPYWPRIRHTGYGLATRMALRAVYGEDDLTSESWERIQEKYLALIRPGYYRDVLRGMAGISSCQVNSLEHVIGETQYPDLLMQDLSTVQFVAPDIESVTRESGREAVTLGQWLEIIDWYFAKYGATATAVKNQLAYQRRLDYAEVPEGDAAPLFDRLVRGEELSTEERKALQDYLFRYTVRKAREHGLPVKLHTGYYAGIGHMMLDRVSRNPSDMCRLAADFPDVQFVLMHIGYPYQEQTIALAKHFPNVTIDMCWTWGINPEASERFVRDLLMAVPCSKLLAFGGDVVQVEMVPGYATLARIGLTRALGGLVEDGMMEVGEALGLVPRLMNRNAADLFRLGSPEPAR